MGSWIPLPPLLVGQGLSSDSQRKVGSPCQSSAEIKEDGEGYMTTFIFRAGGGQQENCHSPDS